MALATRHEVDSQGHQRHDDRITASNGLFTVISVSGSGTVYLIAVKKRCNNGSYEVAVQPFEHGHVSGTFYNMKLVRGIGGMIRLLPVAVKL